MEEERPGGGGRWRWRERVEEVGGGGQLSIASFISGISAPYSRWSLVASR